MPSNQQAWDYESVTPTPRANRRRAAADSADSAEEFDDVDAPVDDDVRRATDEWEREADAPGRHASKNEASSASGGGAKIKSVLLKRGHSLTYAALFVFTIILYLRPAELYPSALTTSIAFVVGTATLVICLFTQVGLEGTLTARPREVNLILLFCLTGLLSIPLAIEPATAWETFSGAFIRCVLIFIVMVNAARTLARLRGLLCVALVTGLVLSVKAVNDYRLGNLTVEGYRVGGVGEGIFGNPNDLALFLVTIAPVAVAMLLASRSILKKIFYAAATLLMMVAVMVTFSRGAFLGLAAALALMAWKIGRRNRVGVVLVGGACLALLAALAPGNYLLRLLSIFVPGLDPVGSSDARLQILLRSIWTAIVNPLFGIGMGNFPLVSLRELVSHNAYTQVAAEMGLPALVVYMMFLLTPLKGLIRIERETYEGRKRSRYYHLAVGLQASLVGYMINSFFASVAYVWYVYYVVGYAVCLRRIYESEEARRSEADAKDARESVGVEDEDTASRHHIAAGG